MDYVGKTKSVPWEFKQGTKGEPCVNCGERPATIQWCGESGSMAFIHGMYVWWCEICASEAQLKYATEQALRIPDLERRLAELRSVE